MLNFVMMTVNAHQLEEIVRLADKLGVNQVNFKQCDVSRGDNGKCFGLYAPEETKGVKIMQKSLDRAENLARKLNITTTAFSFTPEELSVCDQDPRSSMFISYNGSVSPCINLAIGGPSAFLGDDVEIPTVSYGSLPSQSLEELWETNTCEIYKKRFRERVIINNAVLQRSDLGHDLIKLQEAFDKAIEAMPDPPNGCEICHYLYGV
jgi:MoaA/NifB/PqqE/SkfB family radical SAM enzyme